MSPRAISPILEDNFTIKLNDQDKNCNEILEDRHENDLKKIELIKQRMDLMKEQQELREMLEKQEEMLKEKQVEDNKIQI